MRSKDAGIKIVSVEKINLRCLGKNWEGKLREAIRENRRVDILFPGEFNAPSLSAVRFMVRWKESSVRAVELSDVLGSGQ